ncbi:LacI family DNA-binding transcriptional regulator [Staphylococcus cohnii]|uniref:LacI family DNA-binding transcriptional regulator n=1 Tax=Staphylococcus cohnii TaxID=29382 RepID=UPI003D7C5247
MTNVKDVAKLAQVSTATVSRVISDKDKVTRATRVRVLKAMKELDYYPNNIGRQLRKMETMTILVLVPDITNSFFSTILKSIENKAIQNGYEVLLGDTQNKQADKYFTYLYEKKVDGIISLTSCFDIKQLKKVSEKFPVVIACENIENINIPCVTTNNILGAEEMTRFLIKQGHNNISHISGPLNGVLGNYRMKGFKQEMLKHKLSINEEWLFEGDFSIQSGYEIGKKILKLNNIPSAIFASNDEMAIGIMKVFKNNRISIPNDVSIVGFDNIVLSEIIDPELTTYAQPAEEIGNQAIKKIFSLIEGKQLKENYTLLKGEILERGSTKNVK